MRNKTSLATQLSGRRKPRDTSTMTCGAIAVAQAGAERGKAVQGLLPPQVNTLLMLYHVNNARG